MATLVYHSFPALIWAYVAKTRVGLPCKCTHSRLAFTDSFKLCEIASHCYISQAQEHLPSVVVRSGRCMYAAWSL